MDFEAALREACIEADKTYWETFFERMDSMPDIIIPEDKDNRLREFIRNYRTASGLKKKNRKGMTRGIKALLIAAIILLIAAFTAFAFEPVRSFVYKVYTDCTEFVFSSVKGNKDDYLYAEYTYIPEGYVLVSDTKTKNEQKTIYSNGSDQIIIRSVDYNEAVIGIDTENSDSGEIVVGKSVGYYSINKDVIILIWSTGHHFHKIIVDSNGIISLQDVVSVAQSALSLD